jgi:hypothetical protein
VVKDLVQLKKPVRGLFPLRSGSFYNLFFIFFAQYAYKKTPGVKRPGVFKLEAKADSPYGLCCKLAKAGLSARN